MHNTHPNNKIDGPEMQYYFVEKTCEFLFKKYTTTTKILKNPNKRWKSECIISFLLMDF